uniref:Uncharacterized protein n=1 Tax=Arundo donax TaxID=35708 RepID=A0A0A9G1Z9_ARUDO
MKHANILRPHGCDAREFPSLVNNRANRMLISIIMFAVRVCCRSLPFFLHPCLHYCLHFGYLHRSHPRQEIQCASAP